MSDSRVTHTPYATWPADPTRRRWHTPDVALTVAAVLFIAWVTWSAVTALTGPVTWTWQDDAGRTCTAAVTPTAAAIDCANPTPSLRDLFDPDAFAGQGSIADNWK